MKLVIAGSRSMHVSNKFIDSLVDLYKIRGIKEVVSGACGIDDANRDKDKYKAQGIDGCGEAWATEHNVPIRRFYAKWTDLGRKAGPIRNKEMAENSHALLLIWDGRSAGSKSMKFAALAEGIKIYECILRQDNVKSFEKNTLTETGVRRHNNYNS